MEEGRLPVIAKRKARLILNKDFPVRNELQIGDTGQMLITGILDAEEMLTREDDRMEYIKTFLIKSVKLVNNNKAQRVKYDNID